MTSILFFQYSKKREIMTFKQKVQTKLEFTTVTFLNHKNC